MKTTNKRRVLHALLCLFMLFIAILPCAIKMSNGGGMSSLTASADAFYNAELDVEQYDVHMRVRKDRKIEVYERIRVHFLDNDLTMFYRSLPTDGARYENIEARCEGNEEFYFYVADNEEGGPFIDVNCVGNADMGRVWTYEITYLMEQGTNAVADGMGIDVVGFGWMIPLNNVSVTVDFPVKPSSTQVYTDVFGSYGGADVKETWLSDTSLLLQADRLDLVYSAKYDEVVANGITLQFTFAEGVLEDYHATRAFTQDLWKILLGVGIAVALAVVVTLFLGRKRELVTVVNLSPPKGMDPMKMGKWIDGAVNSEDITSMVYYFANKGYLTIDFTDEDDPTLIAKCDTLPQTEPIYAKTLFNGLFGEGKLWQDKKDPFGATQHRCVKVSELTGKFYEASQTAVKQVPDVPPMYEAKSVFAYLCGPILALVLAVLLPLIVSLRVGGGYGYMLGVFFMFPLCANAVLGFFMENYRYKWKKSKRTLLHAVQVLIALVFGSIFVGAMADFVLTGYEKSLLVIGIFATAFMTSGKLSRTEAYLKVLEEILGFKEFIVATEEDKIKVMLENNPELYYDVLPYAQVLGVTDEWEGKFKNLLIEPPSWYYNTRGLTYFDCYLINRCLTRSMMASMARAASQGAGSLVGGSGGGGSFGGFGGGGFGGGGGGAR